MQATVRNNTSNAYSLHLVGLPWKKEDRYELKIQRVANDVPDTVYLRKQGKGNVLGESDGFSGFNSDGL